MSIATKGARAGFLASLPADATEAQVQVALLAAFGRPCKGRLELTTWTAHETLSLWRRDRLAALRRPTLLVRTTKRDCLEVHCPWHGPGSACMVCGRLADRIPAILAHPEWRGLHAAWAGSLDERGMVGLLRDWLADRGFPVEVL